MCWRVIVTLIDRVEACKYGREIRVAVQIPILSNIAMQTLAQLCRVIGWFKRIAAVSYCSGWC